MVVLYAVSEVPDHIFLLENCPHDWLFPQCSAVCPTTVVPFFGDQFFWGDRIHQKGLGPEPIPIPQLSIDALSDAIRFMLQPE
ncbi:Sterol 3-beta-glucosyltransferase UGT80B1, partial [Bienertia sinuspersici]